METFVPASSSIAAAPPRAVADRQSPRLESYLAVVGLAVTVMTSAAHHDYKQPPSWNKRQFDPKGSGLYNDYLNSVAYTDSSLVQGLLDGLSQRHLLDSTIVIVMGDHGQAFGDHQELVHGRQVYEETTRVPMVIYAPGRVAAGQRITGNRQTIDLLPTIADLLGVEIDGGHIPGTSMLSDVASDREIWLSSAFFKSSLGLLQGDRKVHFFFDRTPTHVFAITTDPNEERDVSSSIPPDELRAYEDRMLLWRARVIRALLAP